MSGITLVTHPTPRVRDYLLAESDDRLRIDSRRHGRSTVFSLSQAHDGHYFLTPQATVIALHHIAEPGLEYEASVGDEVLIDGSLFRICEDRPLDGPHLERVSDSWGGAIAHVECGQCSALYEQAISVARVTGSVEASVESGGHKATATRIQ
jgi:hypothetical protein